MLIPFLLLHCFFAGTASPPADAKADPQKQLLGRLEGSSGTVAAFSVDGTAILTAGGDAARVWDAKTLAPLTEPLKHEKPVKTAVLSPNGRQVMTAAGTTASIWDVTTGRRLLELKHADRVFDAAFSPDGATLATACLDKHIRLWDATTGKLLTELKHEDPVRLVSFSPDGKRLLAGTVHTGVDPSKRHWKEAPQINPDEPYAPGDAIVWDVQKRRVVSSFIKDDDFSHCRGRPLFSPDGKRVGVPAGGHGAAIFDAATGDRVAEWVFVTGMGDFYVDFSRDGKRFLVAGWDGHSVVDAAAHVLEIVPLADKQPKDEPAFDFNEVQKFAPNCQLAAAAISQDGQAVALANDGVAGIWDVATGKQSLSIPDWERSPKKRFDDDDAGDWRPTTIAFDPAGKRIVVGFIETIWRPGGAVATGQTYTSVWTVPMPPAK